MGSRLPTAQADIVSRRACNTERFTAGIVWGWGDIKAEGMDSVHPSLQNRPVGTSGNLYAGALGC